MLCIQNSFWLLKRFSVNDVDNIATVFTSLVAILGVSFGAIQTRRKQDTEKVLAEREGESKAIATASNLIETINRQYDRLSKSYELQSEEIDKLKLKLDFIQKEVDDCREDRQILIRIVQDNNIMLRVEDAERLQIGVNDG